MHQIEAHSQSRAVSAGQISKRRIPQHTGEHSTPHITAPHRTQYSYMQHAYLCANLPPIDVTPSTMSGQQLRVVGVARLSEDKHAKNVPPTTPLPAVSV